MNTQEYERTIAKVDDVISTLQHIHSQGPLDDQAVEIYSKQMAFVIDAVPQRVMDDADISLEGFFSNTKEFVSKIISEAIKLLQKLVVFLNDKFGRKPASPSKKGYKRAKEDYKMYKKKDKVIKFKYVVRNYKDIRLLTYNIDQKERCSNVSVLFSGDMKYQVGENKDLTYTNMHMFAKNIDLWAKTAMAAVKEVPYDIDRLNELYNDVGDIITKVLTRINDEVIKDKGAVKLHYDNVPNDTLNAMLGGFCEETFVSVGIDGYMLPSNKLGLVNTRFELTKLGANDYYTVVPDSQLRRLAVVSETENAEQAVLALESISAKELTGIVVEVNEIASKLNAYKFEGFVSKFDKDTKNMDVITSLLKRLNKTNDDLNKTSGIPDDQKQIAEFEIQECIKYIDAVIAIRRILLEAITYSTLIRPGALARVVNSFTDSVNKRLSK